MSKRSDVWSHFYAVVDGKVRYKLCRANTGYIGGSTNWRVLKRTGYPGTRFNTRRVPGFSNTRKSEHYSHTYMILAHADNAVNKTFTLSQMPLENVKISDHQRNMKLNQLVFTDYF